MSQPTTVILDMCDYGHKFAKLHNHPHKDGRPRCPMCLSIGLDAARAELERVALLLPISQAPAGIVHHPPAYAYNRTCGTCKEAFGMHDGAGRCPDVSGIGFHPTFKFSSEVTA